MVEMSKINKEARALIAKCKIKEALELLIENGVDEALSLLSRFNSINRRNGLGSVSNADYTLEINNITQATLEYAGINFENIEPIEKGSNCTEANIEFVLHGIMATYRKRNPEIISKAKELLVLYRNWKDEKVMNPLYDPSNKSLQTFQGLVDDLVGWISTRKEESFEEVAEKVSKLFDGKIPDYYQLKEAYKLLETKGFNDQCIEKQLKSEVLFLNTRIEITEKIEQFILSLLNK